MVRKKLVVAYLAGGITAPAIAALIKPHLRTIAKVTIMTALRVKKAVAEVAEDLEDLTAEAMADTGTASGDSAAPHRVG